MVQWRQFPERTPFMITSNLLIKTNLVYFLSKVLHPLFGRLFHVSSSGCYAILIGFLCGYPMGAKTISDLILSNQISVQEGRYLLSFCNNTSPMFLLSYIVMQTFDDQTLAFATLGIFLISPVLCSFEY